MTLDEAMSRGRSGVYAEEGRWFGLIDGEIVCSGTKAECIEQLDRIEIESELGCLV